MGSPWDSRVVALAFVTLAVAEDIWSVTGYRELRKRCKWYDSTMPATFKVVPAWDVHQWQIAVEKPKFRTCVLDPSGPDGDTVLHIVLLGNPDGSPTRMAPGAWRMWESHMSYPQSVVQENLTFVRLAAWRFWSVFANGSDVPLPPLHNHHAIGLSYKLITQPSHDHSQNNVSDPAALANWMLRVNGNRWGSAGDSQCDPEHGGPECYMDQMPPGTAMVVPSAPVIDVIVNDVRPKGSSSEEYPIWHELATLLYKPTPTPQFTGLRDVHNLQWLQQDGHQSPFNTFTVPSEGPSVVMMTHAWPFAGQIVREGWHGHHSLTDEGFIFSGGALSEVLDELGLKDGGVPPGSQPQLIQGDVKAFKNTLLAKARASGARLLCRYLPHYESLPPVAGMAPRLYDRKALPAGDKGCRVQDYRFKAGEAFTVLCINKPGKHGDFNQQHCNWFSFYAPDSPIDKEKYIG